MVDRMPGWSGMAAAPDMDASIGELTARIECVDFAIKCRELTVKQLLGIGHAYKTINQESFIRIVSESIWAVHRETKRKQGAG